METSIAPGASGELERNHPTDWEVAVDNDVAGDIVNCLRTVERTKRLYTRVTKRDGLIDDIVYELYGLTGAEIEIMEGDTVEYVASVVTVMWLIGSSEKRECRGEG